MNGKGSSERNVGFAPCMDRPRISPATPGWIELRRKRAMWVARAISVARRRELKRRIKEQLHGNHGQAS